MHLFQSDNIWKRQARARRQAEHPPAPQCPLAAPPRQKNARQLVRLPGVLLLMICWLVFVVNDQSLT